MIYGIKSWNQMGDSACLTGAVRNVRLVHPDIYFRFTGNSYYLPLFANNTDFTDSEEFTELDVICYGHGEAESARGNHVEAQTYALCERIGIPYVPTMIRKPLLFLADEEVEWGRQFQGKWLVNANCQTCSVSKHYPHWQAVVDGMLAMGMQVVQVGGREDRDISTDLRGVEDWRGRTGIRQYISMVRNCAGIVSPGSGIEHIGACYYKPMVIIKGAREPVAVTGYPTATYITTPCDSAYCFAQTAGACRHYSNGVCRCMDIDPSVILKSLGSI